MQQQLNQYSPDGSIGGSLAGELPQLPLPTVSGNDTKVLVIERPQKQPGDYQQFNGNKII